MSKTRNEHIAILLKSLPELPGVYQFFDSNGVVIYIGKAKNLARRVSSYFAKSHDHAKLRILVSRIRDIRHIVVETETDALLLENNMIKKYHPRYNVILKDDKTFPWICVKQEDFPRVFYTRALIKDGSTYFGPYTSMLMVKTILGLIRQLYPLRNCSLKLSYESIELKKYKVCLEYHLGNCKAPCTGAQSEDEYQGSIAQIRQILKGNVHSVSVYLKERMMSYAVEQKFEQAQEIKNKIEIIENYKSKSTVVSPTINNVDVFSFVEDEKSAFVNYLKVVNGAIIQAHTVELVKRIEETAADLLTYAIVDIRQRLFSDSPEIIVPFGLDFIWPGVKLHIPRKGDKLKLLELSQRNARYFQMEKKKRNEKPFVSEESMTRNANRILNITMKDFRLTELPVHIECFDNSNIQGASPVAACVVFRKAKPFKSEYRKYNIKTVVGIDDFASMKEVVYRRYKRLIDEGKSLPQLVIIDGGKGQLNAALKSIDELELRGKIAIVGIAKKLEEIYFPGDSLPIYINKKSESLKLVQQMRNEAHRFGITFHRDKRSAQFISSELDKIAGIGSATVEKLLVEFKSVTKLKAASFDEIAEVVGISRARLLVAYFEKVKLKIEDLRFEI